MKNKTVKMVLSVAVLLICCGAYIGVKTYVAKQEESSAEAEEDTTVSVFSANTDEIKSLEFIINKEETVFAKENDGWVKEDEPEFPVNQDTLDSAASAVASVDSDRVLEDVEDLTQYGLDDPSNTIQIIYQEEDGEETTTVLRVGDKNDSTSQYYVSKDDDRKTVYLVDASCVEPFADSLYDYAKGEDFPAITNTEYVRGIDVNGEESSYKLEKEADTGFWNISGDGDSEKADSAKASSLVTNLGSIAYDKFVDYNCKNESQYGLNKPYAVITVDYQEEVEAEEDLTDDENSVEISETDAEEISGETSEEEGKTEELSEETSGETSEAEKEETEELSEEISGDTSEAEGEETEESSEETSGETSEAKGEGAEEPSEETSGETSEAEEEEPEKLSEETSGESSETEEGTSAEASDSDDADPILEDRQLVIVVGDDAGDDSRYVMVNGSSQVYTISNDTLTSFLGKTEADFWDMTVSYLSVNNLESMNVSHKGNVYQIDVSRETSENEDGEEETTTTYLLDGKETDTTEFTTFYNKLINMAGQRRLTEEYSPEEDAEMTVILNPTDGNSIHVDYYSYDTNYYAAVTDGKIYLVNKMTVKEMFTAFETLTAE